MPSDQVNISKTMNFPQDIPINRSHEYYADTSGTLASSTHDFVYEYGRRYHGYRDGKHIFPNDDVNAQNEEIAHALFLRRLDDKLFMSPIQQPRQILDIGTGIGLWALDMADRYPNAHVRATDLTPLDIRGLPPNLEFLVEDVDSDWIPEKKYDFVHLRSLFGAQITWPKLYRQIFE